MLAILGRPFMAFALFLTAAILARLILRSLPAGPLRTFLSFRMHVIPQNEAERRDWLPVVLLLGFGIIFLICIWFADPLPHH